MPSLQLPNVAAPFIIMGTMYIYVYVTKLVDKETKSVYQVSGPVLTLFMWLFIAHFVPRINVMLN